VTRDSAATVDVVVNGAPRSVAGSATVSEVVAQLGCGTAGVAVAVNDEVVARSAWDDHVLADGDRIEVLRAAQGG
jgi:sulfur carrier protein